MDGFCYGSSFDYSAFYVSAATDTDRHVLESGLLDSPNSTNLDDNDFVGDHADYNTAEFDFNDYIQEPTPFTSEYSTAHLDTTADLLGVDPQGFNTESLVPNGLTFQQPELGASSLGCDVRGTAVSMF